MKTCEQNEIPAAIVGLGRIASLLENDALREKPCTHAGAVSANFDCKLVAGADISGGRRRLFAERWNVPVYAGAEEMLAKHPCKILCIATYPDSHLFYCNLAAKMRVPVVICEKPLADSLRSARKIASLMPKTRIITNHERRYAADYNEARSILMEKTLGEPLSIKASLYMGVNKRLVDVLWHDGTHLVDAIMFLCDVSLRHERRFGAALSSTNGTAFLCGAASSLQTAGSLQATGVFQKSGGKAAPIPFCIELGAGRDHLVFEIEISCATGRLCIGNGVFEVHASAPSTYAQDFRSLSKTISNFDKPTGYFANMLSDAAACVRDGGRMPLSGAKHGLAVIKYLNSVR